MNDVTEFTKAQDMSIIDILKQQAKELPDKPAFSFLDGNGETTSITYAQLDQDVSVLASHLLTNAAQGDRIVLFYPPGLDYVRAFFACLAAGLVSVPLYPPKIKQKSHRVANVIASCTPTLALTNGQLVPVIAEYLQQSDHSETLPLVQTDNVLENSKATQAASLQTEVPYGIASDNLAFLQYTSGSTGTPKGVMIEHGNIVANLKSLVDATGCHREDVFVNWLPLFHDLGLVNTVLLPVYLGAHSVLFAPGTFISRPLRWLEAITRYKGSICGAPNFAFDLCVERIKAEKLDGINLSSWRIAFNAAEPINPDSLLQFSDKFRHVGFSEQSFYPSYGMAEATVFLTGGIAHQSPVIRAFDADALQIHKAVAIEPGSVSPPPKIQTLVSCGNIQAEHQLCIVDSDTRQRLADGKVGEIWVQGPGIAKGYWALPEQTRETFNCTLADTEAVKGSNWLRTGDLGFVVDNELFVSGRIKDLIIIRGHNYYPQDIERLVQASHDAIQPGGCAAFVQQLQGKQENVALLVEITRKSVRSLKDKNAAKKLTDAVRAAISIEFAISVGTIALLSSGRLPKTSSGKVRRQESKRLLADGQINALFVDEQSGTATEQTLSESSATPDLNNLDTGTQLQILWNKALKQPAMQAISEDGNFFTLGGDSMASINLVADIENLLGIQLATETLYKYDTIVAMTEYLDKLTSQKRKPVAKIAAHQLTSGPVSFAQHRLWFFQQIDASLTLFNIPVAIELKGKLDIVAFKSAYQHTVNHHKILSSSYIEQGAQLQQVQNSGFVSPLTLVDLRDMEQEQQVKMIASEQYKYQQFQFDLQTGRVITACLIQKSEQDFQLIIAAHHIAVDAWSMRIFIQDLQSCYKQLIDNQQAQLSKPPVSYLDYAIWQRQVLQGEALHRLKSYWQNQLNSTPTLLTLPTDRPRPIKQSYRGSCLSQPIDKALYEQLKGFASQQNMTLFMLMLGTFQLMLHKITGEADIVVGTDAANRKHPDTHKLMGFFVNQLAIRSQSSQQQTLSEFFSNTRETVLAALNHQDMPFEQLLEALRISRDPQFSPLFQVKFLLNESPLDYLNLPAVTSEQVALSETRAQYDLTLSIDLSHNNGVSANFHFNTDLFDRDTIAGFSEFYLQLLNEVMINREIIIAELPAMSAAQQARLLSLSQRDCNEQVNQVLLHETVERIAQSAPNTIAVAMGSDCITYGDLNQRANQLANLLISIKDTDESLVGIYIERSFDLVIALLATVKAGIGFLPLDPSYPRDRLEFMVENSGITQLICSEPLQDEVSEFFYHALIVLSEENPLINGQSDSNPQVSPDPESLAYLLYTSGSTGKPKGAEVTYRCITNLCAWYCEFASLNANSSVLQVIPISFDASIKNMFSPLMAGCKLVLADNGAYEPKQLLNTIESQQITVINCVPSFIYPIIQLAADTDYTSLSGLKLLALGGESTDLPRLADWFDSENCAVSLGNIYGPTECTDISVANLVEHARLKSLDIKKPLPMGTAITNCEAYVLPTGTSQEVAQQLAYPGAEGELYIGGMCVSRGYRANKQATEQVFMDNPFNRGKFYRTGDRVKWLNTGELVYIGRCDQQVKINGVRIETAEIESVLCTHPAIGQACTMLNHDKKLVSFVTSELLNPPTHSQLRKHLSDKMPASMMPSAFVFMKSLPTLPNTKIDKAQLFNMSIARRQTDNQYVAPNNKMEELLVIIWQEVLKQDKVGTLDNFFELGGDSILCVQLVSKATEQGLELSVADVFEAPTISQLAERMDFQFTENTDIQEPENIVKTENDDDCFDFLSDEDKALLTQ